MARLSLQSIKRENAQLVLEAIARKKHITKLEISEETGLSLMTVGKVVSMLGAGGIIMHGKSSVGKAGRRAEVFRLRHDWLIPVFDLSSHIFKFYISDLEGNVLDKVEYQCSTDRLLIGEDYITFLKKTLEMLRLRYRNKKALGVGVAISGVYDPETDSVRSSMVPEFDALKIMTNIRKIFKQSNIVIENANALCARGLICALPDYKDRCISCLTLGDTIECTTVDHGHFCTGGSNRAGRLGVLPYAPGYTYINFLHRTPNTSDIIEPVMDLLRFVAVAYDPDTIYLCSSKYGFTPAKTDMLRNRMKTALLWPKSPPELVYVHSTELESISGIISRIISNWLDDLLAENE